MFIFKNVGTPQSPNFILYEDIDIPLLGLNNAPVLYHDNGKINMITGISTGGAYYLSYEFCAMTGDFNGDLIVNIVDIILLVNIILSDLSYESSCSPDINNDLDIDILDVILILDIILD